MERCDACGTRQHISQHSVLASCLFDDAIPSNSIAKEQEATVSAGEAITAHVEHVGRRSHHCIRGACRSEKPSLHTWNRATSAQRWPCFTQLVPCFTQPVPTTPSVASRHTKPMEDKYIDKPQLSIRGVSVGRAYTGNLNSRKNGGLGWCE